MLKIAITALIRAGIRVSASVYYAVLIEGPADEIEQIVCRARAIMEGAIRVILDVFTVNTDAKLVRYPDRHSDPRRGNVGENLLLDTWLIQERDTHLSIERPPVPLLVCYSITIILCR
jgi:hypothetical protein